MRRLRSLALAVLLGGCGESDDVTGPGPEPTGPPVIESFLTTDGTVRHGDFTSLRWRVANANVVSILPDVGAVANPASGNASVRPYQTTTYTLTAMNGEGSVNAQVLVEVEYFGGVYVNPLGGNDAAAGDRPQAPIATLSEAMARTSSGGAIYLAAGVYDAAIVLDGVERAIYGGLHPTTFLPGGDAYETWIRPTSAATPLVVRNVTSGLAYLSFVKLDARFGGDVAADLENSNVLFEDCTVEARLSASGTAMLVRGTSTVEAARTRIHGGRGQFAPAHAHTRGVAVLDAASLLLTTCFVDGGWATTGSSGVDVATSGSVRLGFNTIGAQVTAPFAVDVATAVRIRAGRPALGGNILFTRGNADRHAITEEAADADPSWLMGNLFISAGAIPYDNWDGDGPDPTSEEQLNEPIYINEDATTLFLNRLVTDVSAQTILVDLDLVDFHLADTSPDPNPARDRGDALLLNEERFGGSRTDIDGHTRPSTPSKYDLGADEF